MLKICVVVILGLFAIASADSLYDASKSPVGILNKMNFNHQIRKLAQDHVKIVEFYAPWCGHCKQFAPEWEKFAKEMKGIVKTYAVNCDEEKDLCKEHDIKGFPTIKVFPPGLLGTQVYEGERDVKSITKFATRFMNNFVTQVKSDNEAAFLNANPTLAKVLLFTDKTSTPLMYKGLSVEFKDKLSLGMVKSEDKALCNKYRVSKFPSVLILLTGAKKPLKYEGKMEYQSLFEFLNRYQETFALNNPAADEGNDKPWLSETVPEITAQSADDVCFKFDGICVVSVVKGGSDGKIPKNIQDTLVNVKAKFERQIQRGAKFSFVWLNPNVENAFASALQQDGDKPAFIALKFGKRNRYATLEGDFTEDNISTFLDRVMGGDARYSALNSLPTLAERKK